MLVSIGLPTYNGAGYLPAALDSLLSQDHAELEIIVSDNASTDATPDICADYARRDGRIRVVREPENRGALWNFRRVVELATGDYFAWHGDDDLRDPRFVSATLARLEATGAMLCTTRSSAIDPSGARISTPIGPPLEGGDPRTLVRRLCGEHHWADIYGLMPIETVRRVQLRDTWGWDVVFTLELALRGRIVHAPETETLIRVDPSKTQTGTADRSGVSLSWNYMMRELVGAVSCAPLPLAERMRLSVLVVGGMFGNAAVQAGLGREKGPYSRLLRASTPVRKLLRPIVRRRSARV